MKRTHVIALSVAAVLGGLGLVAVARGELGEGLETRELKQSEVQKIAEDNDEAAGRKEAQPKISEQQARQIAQAAFPGLKVTEAELETEGGQAVWEVEAEDKSGTEKEVQVDATTGKVAMPKTENDSENQKDEDEDEDEGQGEAKEAE